VKRSFTVTGGELFFSAEKTATLLTTCVNFACFKSIAELFEEKKQPVAKIKAISFFMGFTVQFSRFPVCAIRQMFSF
jgi:hypothetical protein